MVQACLKSVVVRIAYALFIIYVRTYPGHRAEGIDGSGRSSRRKRLGRRVWFAFVVEPAVVAPRISDGEKRFGSDFPLDLNMPLLGTGILKVRIKGEIADRPGGRSWERNRGVCLRLGHKLAGT